jgi:hypothetical protein
MRRHSLGRLYVNPRRVRKSSRRPARGARGRVRTGRTTRLTATRLGRALEVRYEHAGDGRRYAHKFGRGVSVGYTADRRYLIVGPINVKPFIEG